MDHYSPAYVQKQVGHHSITMTVDVFGHWISGEGRMELQITLVGSKPRNLGSAQNDRAKVATSALAHHLGPIPWPEGEQPAVTG
jgi:hypothetical protein